MPGGWTMSMAWMIRILHLNFADRARPGP